MKPVRSMLWRSLGVVLGLGLLAGCEDGSSAEPTAGMLEVNMQVTGAENLRAMMDELERRDVLATVWLSSAEIEAECDYVRTLASRGHEIAGMYPDQITDDTSYEAQRGEMQAMLDAAPDCDAEVAGFRASRFTANDDTPELLDDLGFGYLEQSARAEFLSVYTFRPYSAQGHDYSVLPMPIMVSRGELGSMCDTSACNRMTADELLRYERAAIDFHLRHEEPLILEWHPSLTHPGNRDGWWDAFLGVLDHLESKGDAIRWVTAGELVDRYGSRAL